MKLKEIRVLKTKISNRNKAIKIADEIYEKIQSGDIKKTDDLVKQLSDISGKDSVYIKKISAYRFIKQKEYDKASDILEKVIKQNPTDIDAQLNLCISLYNNNKRQEAYKRLQQLKNRYPEEESLRYFYNQIVLTGTNK
jgi:predicted Zn-dependent protease